ncbi:MAG: amino acid adenylation domain-containing protein [Luteolibacter sp.]
MISSRKTLLSPLAPVQAAMWRARAPGEDVEQVELRFRDNLSPAKVAEAWEATVEATEVLRCRVTEQGVVASDERGEMTVAEEFPEEWQEWLERDRLRGFGEGVPWRTVYFPESRRWVWTFSHALLDGRSITAILRAFLRRLAGKEADELKLSKWRVAEPETRQRAAEHFREILRGVEAAEPDFGRDGRARAAVKVGMAEELEKVAAAAGVTAATIISWAWGQVLARAAGVDAVAVGQVRAGLRTEGEAGFTMNTLPLVLRRALTGDAATEWRKCREEMLALREYENLAPEDLPVEFFPENGPWSGVLMVERGDLSRQLGENAEMLLEAAELHEQPSGDLTASAWLKPDLRLEVETNRGALAAETLVSHWAAVVKAAATHPARDVGEMTRLPVEQEKKLAAWENGGERLPGPEHLAGAWREACALHANRTAVWTPEVSWTYAEMSRRIGAIAHALAKAGVKMGQVVAVMCGERRLWPLALFAIASLGAIYLPLGPGIPRTRLRAMVRDGDPVILLCTPEVDEDFGLPKVALETGENPPDADVPPMTSGNETMAVLYTSGSTGEPKGVLLGHGGVLNEARWAARALELKPGDRMLQFSSPGFDASLEEILSCLLSGATLVPRPEEVSENFEAFQSFLEDAGITVLDLPTAYWSAWAAWLVENDRKIPDCVRATIIGGERASARAVADWQRCGGGTLWNSYGPTEASIVACVQEIRPGWNEEGDPPIGRPLPGYRIRVADAEGRALPPGAAGEIRIGGYGVGPGYHGAAARGGSFVEYEGGRWYRTGDIGHWDEQGRLHFLGRKDGQLKIRGHRIEPEEIVRVLESHPGVTAAHAGPWGSEPVLAAWVRWSGEPPQDWQKLLRERVAAELPAASVPVRWAAVEEFRLTERGKLDRRALPEPELWRAAGQEEPATATERKLAALWDELLGCGTPGRHDGFFDLGGNSLAALRLFARISTDFGISLPMATLIEFPALAALAGAIDRGKSSAGRATLVALREGDGIPLICIHGGDGGVFFYRNLAKALPPGFSVFTLESPALGAPEPVGMPSVEALAAEYLVAVRRHQPRGPYRLVGYSFGGVVVHEMAACLRRAGEEVAFAGLFDTENPAMKWRGYSLSKRVAVFWNSMAGCSTAGRIAGVAVRVADGIGTHFQVKFERWLTRRFPRTAPHGKLRALQVREAHAAAMDVYQPPAVDVPLHLFRTEAVDDKFEVSPDYGWSALTPKLEIIDVPGEHLTMFAPEHAPVLADELAKRLG